MKPTQITELFANIKKTFVSFFSILMFVALGVGIFLGISWAGPALETAADKVFEEGKLHNYQVQYLYGFTDEDVAKIAAFDGVTDVEPVRQSFQTLKGHDKADKAVKVQQLTERISPVTVLEGELPKAANEIALNEVAANKLGYSVGDTITFEKDPKTVSDEDSIEMTLDSTSFGTANATDGDAGSSGEAGASASGEGGAGASASDASASTESVASASTSDASASTSGASASAAETSASASEASTPTTTDSNASSNDDGMTLLNGATYKVTALVESAEYIAEDSATYGLSNLPSGGVDLLAWVPASAFDASAFQDGYPVVYITCEELAGLGTFTYDYAVKSDELGQRIFDSCVPLVDARFDDLYGQVQSKLADAERQLEEGKKKIADGEAELAKGRAELETKKAEGEKALEDAYNQLMQFEALRQEGEAALAQGRAAIAEAEGMFAFVDQVEGIIQSIVGDANAFKAQQDALLSSGQITQAEYDANLDAYGASLTATLQQYGDIVGIQVPLIDHTVFNMGIGIATTITAHLEDIPVVVDNEMLTIGTARAKLAQKQQELAAGEAEYNSAVAQLNEGWQAYYAGQAEKDRLVAEGEQMLINGARGLADAKKMVAENEPKLEKAREKYSLMENSRMAVMSRSYNAGAVEISTFSGVTSRLSMSMAALFILMGLLVSYSAVSRLVHEQVTQIGTKKALGLRSREITLSFLLYSGLAVLAGAIIGTIVGFIVVEGIIGNALSGMFTFGAYPGYLGPGLFIAVSLLEAVLVLGATYLACRSILKKHAVELLRGDKSFSNKTRFYEKWGIWDKLPLLTQTIVNNCVNDKRRVFSTVVGVAGCTALIVTAITLSNDVMKSYDRHYNNVYGFNAITYVDTNVEGAIDKVEEAIEGQGALATSVLRKSYILIPPDGETVTMHIIVPEDPEEFSEAYHVNPVSGDEFDPEGEGVWISQAYADHYGAKVGDTLVFEDLDGGVYEVTIRGINEFWLTYHEVIMGRDYFESLLGSDAFVPNVVLANTYDTEVSEVGKALEGIEGFSSIVDDKTYQFGNFETFSTVSNAVVLIYMILSILMALVVLLNLNTMFIDEKKRELIVLMINGFSTKDAKRYVSNDSIVLTALGIIAGVILGCIMGSATVQSIEPVTATFVKSVDFPAVIIGIIGSTLLSVIMGVISRRSIPKFNLTDINKQ